MPQVTIVFASLLILLGIAGYAGSPASDLRVADLEADQDSSAAGAVAAPTAPKRSVTALIPAFTGGLLFILGAIAVNERWRMHAMHGAVLIGTLGFLAAGGRGASGLAKLFSASADVNTRSLFFVCTMAVFCGVYVALCVKSFIEARRRQLVQPAQPG